MYDLVVTNGYIVSSTEVSIKNMAIKNGMIYKFLSEGENFESKKIIDASGKYVFPGIVDMHFHSRVPGNTEREDFDTATMAAAHGGVTTLIEMPICKYSPSTVENLRIRVDYASERAVIDFGFYGAGGTRNSETARLLAENGVVGFKMFLHAPPKGRENEFEGCCAINNSEILESLVANKGTGLITCVHPEDDGFIKGMISQLDEIQGNYHDQLKTRLPEAEELSVLTVGLISKVIGAKVHACHVSSANAVNAIKYLKSSGVNTITAETCPPYMFMDVTVMEKYGAFAKVNPPLKDISHRNVLIDAVNGGIIDAIASDHAPFLPKEKETEDFLNAPSGMPSVEFLGPAILDKCIEGVFDFKIVPKLMSESPAKLLGIHPKKGALENGSDADFFIFDPLSNWHVDIKKLFTKSYESALPFDGCTFKGKIESTYVRGNKVYENYMIVAKRGSGKFVKGNRYITSKD